MCELLGASWGLLVASRWPLGGLVGASWGQQPTNDAAQNPTRDLGGLLGAWLQGGLLEASWGPPGGL